MHIAKEIRIPSTSYGLSGHWIRSIVVIRAMRFMNRDKENSGPTLMTFSCAKHFVHKRHETQFFLKQDKEVSMVRTLCFKKFDGHGFTKM